MYKIIIIDDDSEMRNHVKQIIRKLLIGNDIDVKIDYYSKYNNDLQKEIDDLSTHKIYLLDIELDNNESGVQIAKKIRQQDWDSQIVFMTNHDKMFETVYRSVYQVFDFIEKFHDFDNRLEDDLKSIFKMKFDNKMFCYSTRSIDLQVYYKSILYVYRDTSERKVYIITDKNKFAVALNINEMLDKLDDRFVMVHRACIVNKDRVQKFDWPNKLFVLDTGEQVPLLSKKFKKGIEEK